MRLAQIEGTPLSKSEESSTESGKDQDPQKQNEAVSENWQQQPQQNKGEDDGGADCLEDDDEHENDKDSWLRL